MRHVFFGRPNKKLSAAILIKSSGFHMGPLMDNYVQPLVRAGLNRNSLIGFTLAYKGKKAPAALKKEYLAKLLPEIKRLGITTLYVADGEYFKSLTKNKKAEPFYGYVCDCKIKGFEHLKVLLGTNYQTKAYNPTVKPKLELSVSTLAEHLKGAYVEPGSDIFKYEHYPETLEDIRRTLEALHKFDELTCDFEAFSLKFYDAGIGTVSFAWNEHHGVAFPVDYRSIEPTEIQVWDKKDKKYKTKIAYGEQIFNNAVRELLKEFFVKFKGKFIWHNAGFDMKLAVYQLWMEDLGDYKGMLEGIRLLASKFDDTKLISYLATNNTVKNDLKLKSLAQEFAGNFAQDEITDIRLISQSELLKYNLTDCLSTWYVKKKYYPKMMADQQEEIYLTLFKPAVKKILQMELVGMPIDPDKVQEAKEILEDIVTEHMDYLQSSRLIKDFHYLQLVERAEKESTKLKTKERTIEDLAHIKFNPNSDVQLQALIYDYLGYDVIDKTDTGAPAVGGKTLAKLVNHARTDEHREIFEHLIGLAKANKVLTSFIPAFEQAQQIPDGSWRLYGNFNLGGTQSGRLSSSEPNIQNVPSGSTYAKIIKMCFISPPGWLFCGADFNALEAVCEALLSRDPNKLKVYIDGYDSHCVNTFAYFSVEMPDIIDRDVNSINSIQDKYPKLRQKSKAPTFALQYQGTWRTIMKSAGLSAEMSQVIETNYKDLYKVSISWINGVLDEAHSTGYIVGAFGLRIRTPVLAQTDVYLKKMPYAATAERRSAGNAKTQSYGLLNTRAGIEFQERTLNSPYIYDIMPVAEIHDAGYLLVKDKPEVVKWVNDNFIECMCWQELPELQHDFIKLGAELDVFWPDWASALTLPNNISEKEIRALAWEHKQELKEAA
jgi:DNA polymerase I